MRERDLKAWHESLALERPFRISRGTKTAADVVCVAITQDGVTGRGECVPYPRYGETIRNTLEAIDSQRDAISNGAGRAELLALLPAGAARNALDCALWDLEAQRAGSDVATLLGLEPIGPAAIPSALTVVLDSPEAMGDAAKTLADVPLLKVKVDREGAEEQLRAVRAAAPTPRLIVDPNESWTMDEVTRLQDLMVALRVDLLEQPLPAQDDRELDGFASRVPIAADESIHTLDDLARLPSGYSVINIKLDKAGGLTAAMDLARESIRRGMTLMTGCMVCSSLSIAPARILARQSRFVDLDGPIWLAQDRPGGVRIEHGMMSAPSSDFWGGLPGRGAG